MELPDLIRDGAWCMLNELKQRRLRVVKVRTEDGWRRIATETNPEWYQDFCESYKNPRKKYSKIRTYIKRQHTMNALKRIISGCVSESSQYVQRLIPFIEAFNERS